MAGAGQGGSGVHAEPLVSVEGRGVRGFDPGLRRRGAQDRRDGRFLRPRRHRPADVAGRGGLGQRDGLQDRRGGQRRIPRLGRRCGDRRGRRQHGDGGDRERRDVRRGAAHRPVGVRVGLDSRLRTRLDRLDAGGRVGSGLGRADGGGRRSRRGRGDGDGDGGPRRLGDRFDHGHDPGQRRVGGRGTRPRRRSVPRRRSRWPRVRRLWGR